MIPNKDLLNDLIKQAESLKRENYSEASWNLLQNTINSAREVLANENATEEQVSEAQTTLSKVLTSMESNETNKVVNTTAKPSTSTTIKNGDQVATGDNNDLLAYGTLLFTALGCSIIVFKSRKNNQIFKK